MPPDQTNTFTADNIGNPEPVIIRSLDPKEVEIWENARLNTTSFKVHEPNSSSPGVTMAAGESYVFKKYGGSCYQVGEIAGYVETIDAASATFAQRER